MKIEIKVQPSTDTPTIHLKLMDSMDILEKSEFDSASFLELS